MQFAIFASFAALALAAPWKPETSTCSTSTVAATTTSAAAVTATTAASAPGVTPISGTGSSGSGSGSSGSGSSGSGSSSSGSGSEPDLCPALYTPQCCQADVLGLVGLTCNSPSLGLTFQQSFVDDCADTGSRAQCCILPVAGQAVICTDI